MNQVFLLSMCRVCLQHDDGTLMEYIPNFSEQNVKCIDVMLNLFPYMKWLQTLQIKEFGGYKICSICATLLKGALSLHEVLMATQEVYGNYIKQLQMGKHLKDIQFHDLILEIEDLRHTSISSQQDMKHIRNFEDDALTNSNITVKVEEELDSTIEIKQESIYENLNVEVLKSDAVDIEKKKVRNKLIKTRKKRTINPSTESFECEHCEKTFKKRFELNKHSTTHSNKKPFKCTECDARFKTPSALKRHSEAHSNKKPFKCTECDARYKRPSGLKKHTSNIHKNTAKQFNCKKCQQKFTAKYSLDRHMLGHSGAKPFKCKICKKKFSRNSILSIHNHVHTGEWPLKCEHCGKKFRDPSHLYVHKRFHTGDRPYQCQICQQKFFLFHHLNDHVARVHKETNLNETKTSKAKGSVGKSVASKKKTIAAETELVNIKKEMELNIEIKEESIYEHLNVNVAKTVAVKVEKFEIDIS